MAALSDARNDRATGALADQFDVIDQAGGKARIGGEAGGKAATAATVVAIVRPIEACSASRLCRSSWFDFAVISAYSLIASCRGPNRSIPCSLFALSAPRWWTIVAFAAAARAPGRPL